MSRHHNTFKKTQCNVWNDKPELIDFERCFQSRWHPSVHDLKNEELIVYITSVEMEMLKRIKIRLYNYQDLSEEDQKVEHL